jgi:hypothetical protein
MRRPSFTALSPCPIAKELVPVHPRKVFYYLTTSKHQELPGPLVSPTSPADEPIALAKPRAPAKRIIISPSLSNASVDADSEGEDPSAHRPGRRTRMALSPSPEVDLDVHVSEDLETQDASTSTYDDASSSPTFPSRGRSRAATMDGRLHPARDLALNSRARSPQKECDEREFELMARGMKARGMSLSVDLGTKANASTETGSRDAQVQTDGTGAPEAESEEERAEREGSEAVVVLFGARDSRSGTHTPSSVEAEREMDSYMGPAPGELAPYVRPADGARADPDADVEMLSPVSEAPELEGHAHVETAAGSSPPAGEHTGSGSGMSLVRRQEDEDDEGEDDEELFGGSIMGESGMCYGMGWDMGKPEMVGMDELDEMFGGF